jgi:hypothetical protein
MVKDTCLIALKRKIRVLVQIVLKSDKLLRLWSEIT